MQTLWQITGWIYGGFMIWMFFDCIYCEEDKVERLTWSIVMFLLMPLVAPVYFLRKYLPRRREKKGAGE